MRWIVFLFLIGLAIYIITGKSSRHLAVRRLAFAFFAVLSLVSIFFHSLISDFAIWIGVNSGTELLVYLSSFAFIAYVISTYKWKRNLEIKLTELARTISINESKRDH